MEQPTLVPASPDPDAQHPDGRQAPDAPAPDPVVPDTKDWTWVLERPCTQCGLVASDVLATEVSTSVRTVAAAWQDVLGRPGTGERPEPATWSPLEYGAHVRDVLALADERVTLMLDDDDPAFANWDQDATAVAERYDRQDPAEVATALSAAGEALAARLDGVSGATWERSGRRSDGSVFTVASFARYVLHDVAHHLHDVR